MDWRRVIPILHHPGGGEVSREVSPECPLGEPGFVEELEAKFQVRLRPLPPGPRAKKPAQARELPVEIVRQAGA